MLKSFVAILGLLFLFLSVNAGLVAQADDAPSVKNDSQEFIIVINKFKPNLNIFHALYSAEAQIFTGVYEGLFTYKADDLTPQPAVAESFTVSNDKLTYTFKLRESARWSDGSKLVADDFRNAWLREIDPKEKAEYAAFFDVIAGAQDYRSGKSTDPNDVGIKVIDPYTLQVKLAAPAPYFTRLLCHHSFSPVHPKVLADPTLWNDAAKIIYNGPFTITSFTDNELVLSRNPNYWDSANVFMDSIKFQYLDDEKKATQLYNSGGAHWLAGPIDLKELLVRDDIQAGPVFGTRYLYFNCISEAWSKAEVRRALALLLPWDQIRSRSAYAYPTSTLVLPFAGYTTAKGIDSLNASEALDLLRKAGYTNGKGLPELHILVPAGADDSMRIATIMKTNWEKQLKDFKVVIDSETDENYGVRLRSGPIEGKYDIGITTWIGDFADPMAFLALFTSNSNLNDGKYKSKEYDELLKNSALKSGLERYQSLAQAESKLLADAAVMPLFYSFSVNVIDNKYILGWYPNVMDIHPLKSLKFGAPTISPNEARAPQNKEQLFVGLSR